MLTLLSECCCGFVCGCRLIVDEVTFLYHLVGMFSVKSMLQHTTKYRTAYELLRELSFLKLGAGVEEFLEGYQIFWPRFIGVSNISEKLVKCLMGCKIFGKHFRLK